MEAIAETIPQAEKLTDPLDTLVAEIADVTMALGELTALERPVSDSLREQVARILNRYEQRPDQVRDIEERIMEIRDPLLPVALLQQYFLVRSEPAERSIVSQLVRLTQVSDPKASKLALDALREAAYSEIDRLRNLGARALCASERLDETELYSYAADVNAPFLLRVEATAALIRRQCANGPEAFLLLLTTWCGLHENERFRYNEKLRELARSFKSYQGEENRAEAVVKHLFGALENNRFARFDKSVANDAKRVVQTALASLEEATLAYAEKVVPQTLSYDHVFTLKRISRRSPVATRMLIKWLEYLAIEEEVSARPEGLAREITRSLNQAVWGDTDVNASVKELEALLKSSWLSNSDEIIEQLRQLQPASGSGPLNLEELLAECADEYETWGELDKSEILKLRSAFEKQYKRLSHTQLTPAIRQVLIAALNDTGKDHPWRASIRWFTQNYQHFQGEERITILEAAGQVAKAVQRPDIVTSDFRTLQEFLVNVEKTGTPAEAAVARNWLSQLSRPVRPERVQMVKGNPTD